MLKPPSALLSLFSQFDLSSRPNIVAAVSGGSDSTALLLLLREHLLRHAPNTRLVAVTVDHGLRSSSAAEAEAVARLCAGKEIEHRTLRWSEAKPSSGIPAAAREARYRLLAQAAREAGTDIVFTGHTVNDQAETVFMRKARGDGLGLSGMAPATLYDGTIWLLRPFLGERRAVLRNHLISQGVPWAEDATNADARFERPRVRARLKDDTPDLTTTVVYAGTLFEGIFDRPAQPGGEIASLLALARRRGRDRADLANRGAVLLTALARLAAPGLLHLDPSFARYRDRPAALHALRVLLATVGGSEFLPPAERIEAVLERLAKPPFRGTLSRTLVAARGDGVWLARETRGLPGPVPVEDGAIWDGRFRLRVEKHAGQLHIAARQSAAAEIPGAPDARLPRSLARAAWAGQPIFQSSASGPVRTDPPDGICLVPVAAPYARFLPSFDLDLAEAVNRLIGAPQIPAPPFREHIGSKA
ncbi:tRNA lysidine(34) synthetase TilS [Mesorhizobium sp. KR9-304]|uniref:tRNA lysidine(34) synthetase TilS n=1 Tax=Mesorhizobium sp. KR9-304 TaxID=3156614 RepID=UPI0032B62A27